MARNDDITVDDMMDILSDYAHVFDNEYGETLQLLESLYYQQAYISVVLSKALKSEIKKQYKYLTNNFKIVEKEIQVTQKVKELEEI